MHAHIHTRIFIYTYAGCGVESTWCQQREQNSCSREQNSFSREQNSFPIYIRTHSYPYVHMHTYIHYTHAGCGGANTWYQRRDRTASLPRGKGGHRSRERERGLFLLDCGSLCRSLCVSLYIKYDRPLCRSFCRSLYIRYDGPLYWPLYI